MPQLREIQRQFHRQDLSWSNLIENIYSENIFTPEPASIKELGDEILEDYLTNVIQRRPNKRIPNLAGKKVSLRDLYVPLKIREDVSSYNAPINSSIHESIGAHKWIKYILKSDIDKIILVQGESGQGKSAFCEMFADELSREHDLEFIPVLIRLKDIVEIKEDLEETLQHRLRRIHRYFLNSQNWLIDTSLRFLILLDGFDEITIGLGEIRDFIGQILDLQENTNHQFLITGRYFSPKAIDDLFRGADNIILGRIQLMDLALQKKWIEKWSAAISSREIGEEYEAFLYGLKDDDDLVIKPGCPKDIVDKLAGEPLSIYLLASLFQIGEINNSDFLIDDGFDGRVKIYQHVLEQTLQKSCC